MKVHHLNCGTMNGFGFPSDDDTGGFFKRGDGVIHCLLIETGDGLVLVDTGWGTRDCTKPSPAVKQFMNITHCTGDLNETALKQVEGLGYNREDVKHIFLTHMHLDHASGLLDFPGATVHVFAAELEAFLHPKTLMEWRAYRQEHVAHHPKLRIHDLGCEQWFGLDCVAPIQVAETDFVMIPFVGHTRGHCSVAVHVDGHWLMHCGDAYGYYRQVLAQPYRHPSGKLMEMIVTTGFKMPRRHWVCISKLLREHKDQIQAFCAHDAHEFNGYK